MIRVLEGTAQEVYRSLLFVVFTVEVYCLSLIPFAGEGVAAAAVSSEWCAYLRQVKGVVVILLFVMRLLMPSVVMLFSTSKTIRE